MSDVLLNRLMKLRLQQFAEDGDGAGGENPAGADSGTDGAGGEAGKAAGQNDLAAQLEQAKAELAKMKASFDKAAHEASERKKELDEANKTLRTKMTEEEIAAKEKKEADEKRDREFAELQKEVAKAKGTKNVMSKLGVDEDVAGRIAESMVGCENPDNALLLIQQAWTAKEKALRLEFGKIPGPGAGGSSEEESEEKAAIELGKRLGRERAEAQKAVQKGLEGYLR